MDFFNELTFLGGIEDIEKTVHTLVSAGPDAIQLTVGQAEVLQRIRGNTNRHWFSGLTWQTFMAIRSKE